MLILHFFDKKTGYFTFFTSKRKRIYTLFIANKQIFKLQMYFFSLQIEKKVINLPLIYYV